MAEGFGIWKTGRFGAGRLKQEVKDGRLKVET